MTAQMTRRRALSLLGTAVPFPMAAPAADNSQKETATIRGQMVDRRSGQPLACTVAVRTASGSVVHDRPHFTGGIHRAGEFELTVPAGETTVTVTRGFDYTAHEEKLHLRAGQRADLRVELERISPLRGLGWYCGDSHIHMLHGERRWPVRFPEIAMAGRASGLDYLAVAQYWDLSSATPESLEQACARESTADFRMTWNLEAPKNYFHGDVAQCFGHGWTVGMRGRTAGGGNAIDELLRLSTWDYESQKVSVPNFEVHALIHELGGIVSYTHPCRWHRGSWGGQGGYPIDSNKFISNLAQELPFDTVAGPTYDMIDVLMQPEEEAANENALRLWFLLLERGYRLAATGSSDSTFDNPDRGRPGRVRVYTRLNEPFSWVGLARAMKAGKNFVTSGPLVQFRAGGHEPGDIVRLTKPVRLEVELNAWASGEPGERLTRIEVFQDGELLRVFRPATDGARFETRFLLEVSHSGWCVVRCHGARPGRMAVTNPIYFEADGWQKPEPAEAALEMAVRDQETGAALSGRCEVLRMCGATPQKAAEEQVMDGRLRTKVAATSRLRVSVPGYAPQTKSIFLDDRRLRDQASEMRAERLLDWRTYEEVQRLLGGVRLEFAMRRG